MKCFGSSFDLREFVRLLVSTETYQNVAVIYDPTAAEPHRYAGPALKRMTAEQLWDSLLTLIAANEWAYQRPTAQDLQAVYGIDMSVMDYEEFEQSYKDYNEYNARAEVELVIKTVAMNGTRLSFVQVNCRSRVEQVICSVNLVRVIEKQ